MSMTKYYIAVNPSSSTNPYSNVRANNTTNSSIVTTINAVGTVVKFLEEKDGWNKYAFPSSVEGWIRNDVHLFTPIYRWVLDVPYVNQFDKDADRHINDCGIAAVASVLRRWGVNETVEDLASSIGMGRTSLTTFSGMGTLARRYGAPYTYKRPFAVTNTMRAIYNNKPVICLVNYKYIGGITFPHFVTAYGISDCDDERILIHEPYNAGITSISFDRLATAMLKSSENGNLAWQAAEMELPKGA